MNGDTPHGTNGREEKSAEELYLEQLYRESNTQMPEIKRSTGINPAKSVKDSIPLASSAPAEKKAAPAEEQPKGPTEEELYLEKLYTMSDDLPDGTIPLQRPSLQNSNYEFHTISVPDKRVPPSRIAAGFARALSAVYMVCGFIIFAEAISPLSFSQAFSETLSDRAAQLCGYAFIVFALGAAAATAGVLTAVFEKKRNMARIILTSCILLTCVFMAVAIKLI